MQSLSLKQLYNCSGLPTYAGSERVLIVATDVPHYLAGTLINHDLFPANRICSQPVQEHSGNSRGDLGAEHRAEGVLEILPQFETGLTDIEGFSHVFVLWVFDRVQGFELLGTPPSDNRAHGVFATRSPKRPNPIGLTVVEVDQREGRSLHVRGVDMLDGTPILDIKPYLSSIPEEKLRRGWLAEAEARHENAW